MSARKPPLAWTLTACLWACSATDPPPAEEQGHRLPRVTFQPEGPPTLDWVVLEEHPLDAPFHPTLVIAHSALSHLPLALRAPEAVRVEDAPGSGLEPLHFAGDPAAFWAELDRRGHHLRVSLEHDGSGEPVLDLELDLAARPDGSLELLLAVSNATQRELPRLDTAFCLSPIRGGAEPSVLDAARGGVSWARSGGRWRKPDTEWWNIPLLLADQPDAPQAAPGLLPLSADLGLMVRENRREGWSAALGWERTRDVSSPHHHCIHAHPDLHDLGPGETLERRGRLILAPIDKDEQLQTHLSWLAG
jgi:hypothetical protein